jgi:hypothetical protein
MTSTYMTRALRARDPRFAKVLAKLGHEAPAPAKPVRTRKAKAERAAPAAIHGEAPPATPDQIETEAPVAGELPASASRDLLDQVGAAAPGGEDSLPRQRQRYGRADMQAED